MRYMRWFILLLFFLLIDGMAYAYTYDTSSIDPGKAIKWEIIGRSKLADDGMYFLVGKNPDPKHLVQYVLFEVYFPANRTLMRFLYYENGKLLVYRAVGRGHYQLVVPSAVDLENARQWLDPAGLYDRYDREYNLYNKED